MVNTGPMAARDPDCLLCRAEPITHWYHADDLCWIADCSICATPMVVWREHGQPDTATRDELLGRLVTIASQVFPQGHWLDPEMRRIPDHFHTHARPHGGFFGHHAKAIGWEQITATQT
jgi:hypothetical protein